MALSDDGFQIFEPTAEGWDWAAAAALSARAVLADKRDKPGQVRNGGTWFVGVDALPNALDGSVRGVALPWGQEVDWAGAWHRAQLSVVFPGYPQQDEGESDAAHRFRRVRAAAHVDGLHGEGPEKRRFLREPHAFILGLPLDGCRAAPLVVWPGSHLIMGEALGAALAGRDPAEVDLTEVYGAARKRVFEACEPLPLRAEPGGAVLLHRHLLHGVMAWDERDAGGRAERAVAYFRPLLRELRDWA